MPRWETGGVFMRFTIRDLLWLMVVVGLAVGWWLGHCAAARRLAERDARISSLQKETKELQSRNAAILKGLYFIGYSVQETGGGKFELKQRRDAKSN
jgi:hypothetical protein